MDLSIVIAGRKMDGGIMEPLPFPKAGLMSCQMWSCGGSALDPVPKMSCCLVFYAQQVRGELERHSKFAWVVLRWRKGTLAPKADRASANQNEGWGRQWGQPG